MLEFPIVKPDGSILAVRTQPPGGLVLSADAGRNFTTVPGKEGVNFLERSPSGTLVAGQVSGPPLLSADGISWTPAPTVPGTR
jgi:hypothetical protein